MKTLIAPFLILLFGVVPVRAWDISKNPDVAPSIGWSVHGGRLAGIVDNNAPYTEFGADVRVPVTNYLSLTADFAQTTVSNAPIGVSTQTNRVGASVRVYLRNFVGD
jgi:hypothetical protein